LAGKTPEEAVDAFVDRVRASLSCITAATAFASPGAADQPRSLALYAHGQDEPGKILLSTYGGRGDLYLKVAHSFPIRHLPDDAIRGPYKVSSSFYQYIILDYGGNEVLTYDWHPTGKGANLAPHLHASAAGSIYLVERDGSARLGRRTHFGSFHLPTGRVLLEDINHLLIDEFQVDPLRADWRAILDDNREAVKRGRTWPRTSDLRQRKPR
jgi:hypothetical protein